MPRTNDTIVRRCDEWHDLEPRSIGFKATIQTLEAFQPVAAGKHLIPGQAFDAFQLPRAGRRQEKVQLVFCRPDYS